MIDAAHLRRVQGDLARRSGRRRREWGASLVVGVAAAAWVAAAGAGGPTRWLWSAVVLQAVAMLRVPFVLYWRADSGLLARLPVRGRPLFDAALWSTGELALQALLGSLIAGLPLTWVEGPLGAGLVLRHAMLAGTMAVATAALIPAVAVGAGALVVSGKAKQIMDGMGGEVAAPPTSWLGVLPGLASALVVLVAIDVAGWLSGGRAEVGAAAPILIGLAAGSLVAAAVARLAADRVMPAMLRDVSALDRQQLASIEVAPAPRTLRLLGRALSPPAARLLDKHARLMSRRYPMAGVIGVVLGATLTITALAAPQAMGVVVATVSVGWAYAWVLEARTRAAPVELPRLLASLPFSPGQVRAATRGYVMWWWGVFVVIPAMVVVARSAAPLQVLVLVLVATGALLAPGVRRR